MQEPYWWYVLRVKKDKERQVISDFIAAFKSIKPDCEYDVFIMESEKYYHNGKTILGKQYLKRPVFPDYVFIATTLPQEQFVILFGEFIKNSANIIKLLRYPNTSNSVNSQKCRYALSDEERMAMEIRFPNHHCLGRSVGKIVGDRLYITLGPLVGKVGLVQKACDVNSARDYDFIVRKIDRHHRTAIIEMVLFNRPMPMTVALEIIEKR